MWLTSFGSRRLNSSSVTLLRWPLSSFHCLYVFLSKSTTARPSLWYVLSFEDHTVLQEFTSCQNKVLIRLTWTPSDSCNCLFHTICGACRQLVHPQWAYFRSIHKSMTKCVSANTPLLLPLCWRAEGQVRWKKEHRLWMLREQRRCLQCVLVSQRTVYSCINAFQDAGSWFTAHLMQYFPSFSGRPVHSLTLVSAQPDKSCWIGYLARPQGRLQQPAPLWGVFWWFCRPVLKFNALWNVPFEYLQWHV